MKYHWNIILILIFLKPGSDCKGLHTIIYDTIQASEIDNRGDLYQYIVLTGGNTMFPGENLTLYKLEMYIQVVDKPEHDVCPISAPELSRDFIGVCFAQSRFL